MRRNYTLAAYPIITILLFYFASIAHAETCQVNYLMGVGKTGDRLKTDCVLTATATISASGTFMVTPGDGWATATSTESIATSTAALNAKVTACNTGAVAGTVTANAGTNLNTSALALDTTLQNVRDYTYGTATNTALTAVWTYSAASSVAALAAAIATPTVVVQGASAPVSGAWPIVITDNTNAVTLLKYGGGSVTANYSVPVLAFFDIAAGTVFSQAGIGGVNADAVTIAGNYAKGLVVGSRNYVWNGAAYDRMRVPTLTGTFAVSGASPQTCLASAGAGKYNRVHEITFTVDTAGLVTLSDGMGLYYMAANTSITQQFKQGKRQATVATAITITNAGAGNVTCAGTYNTE